MKYIVTILSTTLFLSFMFHVVNDDALYQMKENERLSNEIIHLMSSQVQRLEIDRDDL